MQLIFLYDRHMTSKTFTKQNPAVLCNHNALYKNVQVFFEYISPTKELLVKLLLPICLSFYSMYCIIWVNFSAHMPVMQENQPYYSIALSGFNTPLIIDRCVICLNCVTS
jgi:hypothetical protein